MNIYCGIDIGSSSIKIALLNEEVKLIAHSISPTGSSFRKNATIALDNLLSKHQISQTQIKYVVSTGYGRKLFPTADENISEITANATGSKHSFKNQSVLRSIINIGGQDSKVIVLDEVQNLDHKEGSPISKYLREGRKFGLSLILATQTMSNMKKDERDRMFNAAHKLFFKPADTELKSFAEIAALATRQRVDEWIRKLSSLKKGECFSIGPVLDVSGEHLATRAIKIRITALGERTFNS